MSEFRDVSGELIASMLLTSKLGFKAEGATKRSQLVAYTCKHNIYNSGKYCTLK